MDNLLKISDLTSDDITDILNISDQLKFDLKNNIPHHLLEGKTLGMIFRKVSTRTRVSFAAGMYQLGGQAIFMPYSELQLQRGEGIDDTARTLSRYLDAIVIRTFDQERIEEFAKYATVPVINGLTDLAHPCQVIADLLTIREYKNRFGDLKLCFIGDSNNMANSTVMGALKVGMKVSLCCPKGYEPKKEIFDLFEKSGKFEFTNDPKEAVEGADVVVTDSWVSMGASESTKKITDFKGYTVDSKLMENTNDECMVLHCLPARKGEEISKEVFEKHAGEIFDEAENRLHAQKAILVKLLTEKN